MRKFVCSAAALLMLGAPVLADEAATGKPVCIYTHNIKTSQPSRDERSITFTMRNGERWRNDLRGRCSGITMEGFSWVLRGNDRVCDSSQTLKVPTGSVCALGKFTPLPRLARKD